MWGLIQIYLYNICITMLVRSEQWSRDVPPHCLLSHPLKQRIAPGGAPLTSPSPTPSSSRPLLPLPALSFPPNYLLPLALLPPPCHFSATSPPLAVLSPLALPIHFIFHNHISIFLPPFLGHINAATESLASPYFPQHIQIIVLTTAKHPKQHARTNCCRYLCCCPQQSPDAGSHDGHHCRKVHSH